MALDPKAAAFSILCNYLGMLDKFYGMYLDACWGFTIYQDRLKNIFDQADKKPDAKMFFGMGEPNAVDAKYRHVVTIEDLISRNSTDGENRALLSQAMIAFIYSNWETAARPAVAKVLKLETKMISSDVFGDLRLYRHAILHNQGILDTAPKTLRFLRLRDHVVLTNVQMDELFEILFREISSISERFVGKAIAIDFNRRLN